MYHGELAQKLAVLCDLKVGKMLFALQHSLHDWKVAVCIELHQLKRILAQYTS